MIELSYIGIVWLLFIGACVGSSITFICNTRTLRVSTNQIKELTEQITTGNLTKL